MSEVGDLFHTLPGAFQPGSVKTPRTYYFSIDDEKWTVALDKDGCQVTEGKPEKDADCYFKASREMFLNVWNGRYTPSVKDFLMGTIKSNNPLLLKDFIAAFTRP
jgi:putative sterol carrier protein